MPGRVGDLVTSQYSLWAGGVVLALTLGLAGCASGGSASSPPAAASKMPPGARAVSPVPLSTCQQGAGGSLSIGPSGCGPDVYVDQSFTGAGAFGVITIELGGTLTFPNQTLTLETAGIVVAGTLIAGTAANPIGAEANGISPQVTIRFVGRQPSQCPGSEPLCHRKGIVVRRGATLEMFGAKGVVATANPAGAGVSWTYLSSPAGPIELYGAGHGVGSPVLNELATCPSGRGPARNERPIQLAGAVDWQPGDWIVVGTTDFTEHNSEFVRIACLASSSSGTKVWLDPSTPLVNYHFGGPAPSTAAIDPICHLSPPAFCDGYTRNYGVDERAEVGLVSRNVKLTAAVPVLPFWAPNTAYATGATIQATVGATNNAGGTTYTFTATTAGTSGPTLPSFTNTGTTTDNSVTWTSSAGAAPLHWGGEINLEEGSTAQIQGVEIEKFGKDQLGSYPVQVIGTPAAAFIFNSNSIHHSYNKGIVLAQVPGGGGVSGLTVQNNVVARAVGHLFLLADGQETSNTFDGNLGLGAMSNSFSINPQVNLTLYTPGIASTQLFWDGDYMTNNPGSPSYNGYDGFNIPNTDAVNPNAWPSGFYITNPDNTFTNNSIGGCQGEGRGFWYLPIQLTATSPCLTQAVATGAPYLADQFSSNRAHACYNGLDTASSSNAAGDALPACPLQPQYNGLDLMTRLAAMTATRNRNFGIWVRPGWYWIDNARLATNREGISLVSSGGTEGSPPGEWSLLTNSTIVGISANNPQRFGPCPFGQGPFGGGSSGCVNEGQSVSGYPTFQWNLLGYMFYDGPARLQGNRFVNFLQAPSPFLMDYDQAALNYFAASHTIAGDVAAWASTQGAWPASQNNTPGATSTPFQYEGDAALGWEQSNVNSYPPTQYTEKMIFDNVDFRHEVYTKDVNLATFEDGDKNTVVLDRDGTLTGYQVVGPDCQPGQTCAPIARKYPVSLNNLPFLGTPYSVDECLATGEQDSALENRATAMISPQDYATLEMSALTAQAQGGCGTSNCNPITFTKDQLDYDGNAGPQTDGNPGQTCSNTSPCPQPQVTCQANHSCMNLVGRNQQGVYEPKVVNGLGYTMLAQQGFPSYVDIAYTDATVAGGISPGRPFSIRLGICYASANGQPSCSNPPCSPFTVTKGRKSLAAAVGTPAPLLSTFWNQLKCNGLDNANPKTYQEDCPSPPTTSLQPVSAIANLTPDTYFYDTNTGMLFLYVQQTEPNGANGTVLGSPVWLGAGGPSPLGSCYGTGGSACPGPEQTFYSCPAAGCVDYSIQVNDPNYQPGASSCSPYVFPATYDPTGTPPDYTLPYPSGMNQLAYLGGPLDGQLVQPVPVSQNQVNGNNYPHAIDPNGATLCSTFSGLSGLSKPPWINSSNPTPAQMTTFAVGLTPGVQVSFSPVVPLLYMPSGPMALLANGTYTLTATAPPSCSPASACSCQQSVKVDGGSLTVSSIPGENSCASPPSSISLGSPPWSN